MLKVMLGLVIGFVAGIALMAATTEPKQVFGKLRQGVDRAEQIQVEACRKEEASCYVQQGKTQAECDALIKQKCGG